MKPLENGSGKKLLLRGHEVVVHTAPSSDGGFYAFAVLPDQSGGAGESKSVEVRADSELNAEVECARQALELLEQTEPDSPTTEPFKAARCTVEVQGRKVDIFCDLIGHDRYQAFPFLYRPDGKRIIMIRFHLEEAIVADSVREARDECVRRLDEYFREERSRKALAAARESGHP
jgi:hypothetical protein